MNVTRAFQPWLAHPAALGFLLVLPVLSLVGVIAALRRRRALARWNGWTGGRFPKGVGWVRGAFRFLGLASLVVGIAGLQWGRDLTSDYAPGRDVVVLLDMSRSMAARDVVGRSSPDRFGRARDALFDLADAIQSRGGYRLALVVFAARAQVVCPLTNDYDHFRETLAVLDPSEPPPDIGPTPDGPTSGTRIGDGIRTAVEAHDPRFPGYQDIVMVSDGDDPAGNGEWRLGAAAASGRRLAVHTVGIGDPDQASPIPGRENELLHFQGRPVLTRLQEPVLVEIARLTGGTYTPGRTRPIPLGELFRERIEPLAGRPGTDDPLVVYRPRYAWMFVAALLLLGLEMAAGLGARTTSAARTLQSAPRAALFGWAAVALALAAPSPLEEAERLMTRGDDAFERGDFAAALDWYTAAEERATDPGQIAFNEGAALYRLGQFREAAVHYQRCLEDATGQRRPSALFNLGNSLVRQAEGRDAAALRRAVRAYEDCLRQQGLQPTLADHAAHNLRLARALWLKAKAANKDGKPDEPENGAGTDPNHPPGTGRSFEEPLGSANGDPRSRIPRKRLASRHPGQEPNSTSQPPPPGAGNLPPIPDSDERVPFSAEDTAGYLQQTAERVLKERREHLRRSAHSPAPGMKNW